MNMNWQDDLVLESGESILWEGRPVVWRYVASYVPLSILFGPPTFGLSYLLWADPGEPRTAGYWVMLSMLSFLAFLAITAPLHAWMLARGTQYMLTNRRAVILEPALIRRRRVECLPVSEWKPEVVKGRRGSGSILFGTFGMGGRRGFKHLNDLSTVEPVVRQLAGKR